MSLSAAALSEIDSTDSSSPSSSRSQSETTDSSDSDSSNTTSAISESPPPYTEFVDNNIELEIANECTIGDTLFNSYRRDKTLLRQKSTVWI